MPAYYPVFLDLRDRKCVVIGGDAMGEEKATRLHEFGARVEVISPEITDGLRELADGDGLVPERAALAGRLSAELFKDERLADLVSELDVSEGRDPVLLRLRAPAVTPLVHGDSMIERLTEVVPLLVGIQKQYAELDVVDLRFEERTYLRLRGNPGSRLGGKYTQAAFASGGAPF